MFKEYAVYVDFIHSLANHNAINHTLWSMINSTAKNNNNINNKIETKTKQKKSFLSYCK